MAPSRIIKCWMCGRASDEVSASVGRIYQETELDRRYARMEDLMGKFNRASAEWGDYVPDQFKALDFDFVVGNPSQFRSIRFLGEVEDAKKSIVIPLQLALGSVRSGTEASIGGVKIGPSDRAKRAALLREIESFERKTGRHINGSGGKDSLPHGFEGLKVTQGLTYLKEVGVLYFEVQRKLMEAEKEDEMSKRPVFGVSVAKVDGLPGEIPICSVCQNLVTSVVQA